MGDTLVQKMAQLGPRKEPEHIVNSGHVRPRQGTDICNFGVPSPPVFFGIRDADAGISHDPTL